MDYVKLGNSDLRVSRICLGCMGFGDPTIGQHSWTIGEEPTREIIRRSLDLGVNFFDTASPISWEQQARDERRTRLDGSSIKKACEDLKATYPDVNWKEGKLLNRSSKDDLKKWVENNK